MPEQLLEPGPRVEAPIVIETVRSVDDLGDALAAWEELAAGGETASSFVQPSRFLAALEGMGGRSRLHLLVARHDAGVAGMLVAREERRRNWCRFGYMRMPTPRLRCLQVPYSGLLAPDADASAALIDEILSRLRDGSFDHVTFTKLPQEGALHRMLAGERGAVVQEQRPHRCTDLVPGSFDETLSTNYSGKQRRKFRWKLRRLERELGPIEVDVVTREEQLPEFREHALRIAQQSFQTAIGAGFDDSPVWQAMLRSTARAGILRCYLLRTKDGPLSFQIGTVVGTTYVLDSTAYVPSYATLGPGTCLLLKVIEDLCAAGFHRVDYGFGDAEYKREYGTKCWVESNVHLYSKGARATTGRLIDLLSVRASLLAKRIAGSEKAERIKKMWKRRLTAKSERDASSTDRERSES